VVYQIIFLKDGGLKKVENHCYIASTPLFYSVWTFNTMHNLVKRLN